MLSVKFFTGTIITTKFLYSRSRSVSDDPGRTFSRRLSPRRPILLYEPWPRAAAAGSEFASAGNAATALIFTIQAKEYIGVLRAQFKPL